jgi:hypothetical protein
MSQTTPSSSGERALTPLIFLLAFTFTPCFALFCRAFSNPLGPPLAKKPFERELPHILEVHKLRMFNPHLPYNHFAEPLETVLMGFPRPATDLLTDDIVLQSPELYTPPAFAKEPHYEEIPEDWWPFSDPTLARPAPAVATVAQPR